MKNRSLSKEFMAMLIGGYNKIVELVKNDDTIDMEFRGNEIIVYYRGGKIFSFDEQKKFGGIDPQYGNIPEPLSLDTLDMYVMKGKQKINEYQCSTKNNLGEKEISQRIIMENNYSPYSYDTDFFIVDTEYNDGFQFDLVGLKLNSTSNAHRTLNCKLYLIETKQGYNTLRTKEKNPGLKKHYEDYKSFSASSSIDEFKSDMISIFKQKCELGLIRYINEPNKIQINQNTNLNLDKEIDFLIVLANYKQASTNLINELGEMSKEKMDCESCYFANSSYMGYGLYESNIVDFTSFKNILDKKKNSISYRNNIL